MAENLYSERENFLLKYHTGSDIDLTSESLKYDPLFFTKLVAKSFDQRELNVQDHCLTAIHLTNILEKKAKKSQEFLGISEYFVDLVEKLDSEVKNRRYLSTLFADDVLFFNGLFQESFQNSFKNPSFYLDMARQFYLIEATNMEQVQYYELGMNIPTYLGVLRQTRNIINEMEPDPDKKFLISDNDLN